MILTGNAGDGKTYLCRQILAAFGAPVAIWDALADTPVERDGLQLHVVKDLSELAEPQGIQMLRGLAGAVADPSSPSRYLIAANEGRLRSLLHRDPDLAALQQLVQRQLQQGPEVEWRVGLLPFEYLMRLAHGGTYNILAEECELGVRGLKDRLLSAFAGAPDSGEQLEFFVAERQRYSLRKIWIDEQGNIRG